MKPLDQYETPDTDKSAWLENGYKNSEVVTADFARSLERRLAAQTECLNRINNTVMSIEQIDKMIEQTLTLTKP